MATQTLILSLLGLDGSVESGGLLYSYVRSTTTPQAVYTDSGLTTPATNPVIASALGAITVYFNDALSYSITCKTSDAATTLFQFDIVGGVVSLTYVNPLMADHPIIHVSWISALQAPLGTNWATHLGKPLPMIFAADYGVSASNSAAANYTAIQALIAAITVRCRVIWPAGIISTTGAHTFNSSVQYHEGMGAKGTIIACTAAATLFTLGNGTTNTTDYYFNNMGFTTIAGGTGIFIRRVNGVFISNFYENCDTWLRIGDATAAAGAYRVHQINGEGAQVASSTLLSHIKHEWNLGEYKKINVNIEGQRQPTTIGEDFTAQKSGVNIDGLEILGGYMGRFDYNHRVGATRISNGVMDGVNSEGAGISAFHLSTSSATGGLGLFKFTDCTFGTDVVNGAWAAAPISPFYIYCNNASVTFDAVTMDSTIFSDVSKKTCRYIEVLAGTMEGCRWGDVVYRGNMDVAGQYISHIKGAVSGSATIKNCSHGSVSGIAFTNALAGGVKYEGVLEMSAPDPGKVPSTVTYFVDDSHTVPLRQAFALTIVNTAGTMQHKVTGIGGGSAAAKADLISRFTGFSTSLQNTPTATDSSTAMVGGGKIRSGDPSQFVFDSIVGQTTNESIPNVRLTGNTSGNALFFQASFVSSSVNGVTLNRLVITMFRESDGTGFGINTTNLTAGEQVVIEIDGLFL